MDTLLQVAGLGLIAVLLGLVLKKGNGVLALLLTLAACAAMTVSIVRLAEPVVSFLSELRQLAGLEPALLQPLLRTVGIGLLTQLTASVCADAGESAVARWRAMLEAGSTRDPLGLAAIAGIDLSTPDALEHTIAYISGIIDEIAALTEEIDGITVD